MNNHKYTLEGSSKKHHCPNCGKKRFVRYVNTETSEYLPKQYGRCDREVNCSYHLNPFTDGYGNMSWKSEQETFSGYWKPSKKTPHPPQKNIAFIPIEVFKQTLKGYEMNVFIQNLISCIPYPFESINIEKVIALYYLGTVQNGYRAGAITFPFIDANKNIRAVQVKQFDKANHTYPFYQPGLDNSF